MGKQKFKFSHMIPNVWFFKLKHNITNSNNVLTSHKPPLCFSTTTTSPTPPPPSSPPSTTTQPRQSYHFTRDFSLEDPPPLSPSSPPRKSKSRKSSTSRKTTSNPTKEVSSDRKTTIPHDGFLYKGEHFDIIIDFDECNPSLNQTQLVETCDRFEFQLPPRIVTNTKKITKEDKLGPTSTSRRFSVSSPGGVRLKINSPKVMGRKQGHNGNYGGRKSVTTKKKSSSSSSIWESLAVVKTSNDPQRDFRESMVEMIVQKNIRASKDLEDLLACYLSLNSDEYHDVIIKVFRQIWVDLSELRHRHYHKMVT